MFHLAHILVNDDTKTFTYLNRYDRKRNRFEGEYSIVHNEYTYDSFFLEKFLLEHKELPVILLSSDHKRFTEITNKYHRYLEDDIPKIIEEKIQQRLEKEKMLELDRNLGQLQLAILKKMIENQLETIRAQTAKTSAEHQVLLGKELSLQWVLHTIDDIIEKGNIN